MRFSVAFLTASLIMPTVAFGGVKKFGPSTGGGGQGILCDGQTDHPSLETLDLYEAKNVWGYQIPTANSIDGEIGRIAENVALQDDSHTPFIRPTSPFTSEISQLKAEYTDFIGRMRAIPVGSRLEISTDSGNRIIKPPQNCEVVQIIYYADEDDTTGSILVDQQYWDLLTPQNQLALSVHERLYKRLRASGEQNSLRTRKVVGLLFNSGVFPGRLIDLYGKKKFIYCYVDPIKELDTFITFWVVPADPDSKVEMPLLVFENLTHKLSESVLVRTTAFSHWSFADWSRGQVGKSSGGGYIDRTSSVLGSEMIRYYPESGCNPSQKLCRTYFQLRKPDGNWTGGPVNCRPNR